MGFTRLCGSDPLLDFIRQTYDAVPLRLPDPRWVPLTLFTVSGGRVRQLGVLRDIDPGLDLPPERTQLPTVAAQRSSAISWGMAVSVTGPFLSALLGVPLLNLETRLLAKVHRRTEVVLSLGRASRTSVNMLALAAGLDRTGLRLPQTLRVDGPLYVVDSVLHSRELTTTVSGVDDTETTAHIAASLVGAIDPEFVVRSASKVTVRGRGDTPFAITCAELERFEDGAIYRLRADVRGPRAAATPIGGFDITSHAVLGDAADLMDFDA